MSALSRVILRQKAKRYVHDLTILLSQTVRYGLAVSWGKPCPERVQDYPPLQVSIEFGYPFSINSAALVPIRILEKGCFHATKTVTVAVPVPFGWETPNSHEPRKIPRRMAYSGQN